MSLFGLAGRKKTSTSKVPRPLTLVTAEVMILAQIETEQLLLMTADQKMLELDFNWIIDAQA